MNSQQLKAEYKLRLELVKRKSISSFYYFVKTHWSTVISEEFVGNWHIKYLCDFLQEIVFNIIKSNPKKGDYIVNIPPGTSKSTIFSVMLIDWAWLHNPSFVLIVNSNSSPLSLDLSIKSRDIARSPLYKQLYNAHFIDNFGKPFTIKEDKDNKSIWGNTLLGSRIATTTGSSVVGFHSNLLIHDDAEDPAQMNSEAYRLKAKNFHDNVFTKRKKNKLTTPIINVQQRTHTDDLTNHMLKKTNTVHICLPAELSNNVQPIELREKYIDGLLDINRLNNRVLDEEKASTHIYNCQYLQNPLPSDGGMIKKGWFSFFHINEIPKSVTWNFTGDTAYTTDEKNDRSAFICYCYYNNNLYIKDMQAVRLELPELIEFVKGFVAKNGGVGSAFYVEPKASGLDLIASLRRNSNINIIPSKAPTTSKGNRVRAILPFVESRRVYLLQYSHYYDEFLKEVCGFPHLKEDDIVDAFVIAVDKCTNSKGEILA